MELEINKPNNGKRAPEMTAATVPSRITGISGLLREISRERATLLCSSPSADDCSSVCVLSGTIRPAVETKFMLVLPNEVPPPTDLLNDALLLWLDLLMDRTFRLVEIEF
jgi:hypothetical protein